ncbi:MAG: hypothetical protein Q9162_002844 [Coniocarpon cinnabarinum]
MSSIFPESSFHRNTPSLSLTSPGPQIEEFPHETSAGSTELQFIPTSSGSRHKLSHRSSVSSVDLESGTFTHQRSAYHSDEDEDEAQGSTLFSLRMKRTTRSQARVASGEDEKTEHNGNMVSPLEHRRRYSAADGTASQTAQLMSMRSFSLDEEPGMPGGLPKPSTGTGFFELPRQDRRNFLVLVLLYFLQGIPMGLASGSVPFLLKNYLSFGQIGVFSLASYPYSLKLLWSPIVDAVWSPRIGRRKSWILPVQLVSGVGMLYLGGRVQEMMKEAGANGGEGVWNFTVWWFMLVFTCATQDIAVDGWALTLLSQKNISYASTAQTVGLTGGQFLSHTVFLAFNSKDFANTWLRKTPLNEGALTLGGYLTFWGWMYLLVTAGLAVLKREEKTKERDGIKEVYQVMWGILKLKNIQMIVIIHLIAKIGFQANDAVTNLKLLDKGFSQEDMALTVLIDFPFELGLGYYAGKWSSTYPPLQLWSWAFIGRLIAAAFAQFTVSIFPVGGTTSWYLVTVIFEHVFSTFMSTVMFVAISAFHAKIADPVIGGTYMTLLATVSNLGGTFPRYFVLKAVDAFTVATCNPPASPLQELKPGATAVTSPFSCALEADKRRCVDGGGTCDISRDGYYFVNVVCIIIGVVTFWSFIKPQAMKLQSLPLRAWRLEN